MVADISPPGSVFEPLMSPPRAEKPLSRSAQSVMDCLRLHRAGHRLGSWWQRRLRPDDYAQVLRALDADESLRNYVEDKVRYDYDPCRCCLTIRMSSPLHDTFCARVADEISRQLRQYQQGNGPLSDFAQEVEYLATSRILIPEDTHNGEQTYSRREPDASFGHRQAHYLGVIVEVCYAQKSRQVPHLADEYILNTNGSVNAVLAFDIDYKGSKRATVTMWRPEYTTVDGVEEFRAATVIEAQAFRTDSGFPTAATALRLFLRDFATDELTPGHVDLDREVLITSKQLFDFLLSAEARQQAHTQHQGSTNRLRPGALKRRHFQTHFQQLTSEDEGSVDL
ncbi:unnamed protein product [Penicillium roqueforti FM164]|uniref:Genomic scaffold, ProqFM164S01 n=1 Tax=Penicillium roqueforti (strain FM164) TaxID=1365484 RepID=W6PXF5_PENRF|nr:unnamed protein product [Penicillium roqueforti FM164]